MSFFATAFTITPQLVATGAMVANDHKVDRVACVVKAVRDSYVHITAYMTSTADARCPENVPKLLQISGLLLKERRENHGFLAFGWGLRDRAASRVWCLLQWSQHCYLVVSQKNQYCVRNVRSGGQKCSVVGARGNCVRCNAQAIKDSDLAAGLSFR